MDNFLRFLENDHSFFTPWAAPIPENQQLQQEVQGDSRENDQGDRRENDRGDRRENDQTHTPFSFFSRQWDYGENLRKERNGPFDDNPGGDSSNSNSNSNRGSGSREARTPRAPTGPVTLPRLQRPRPPAK